MTDLISMNVTMPTSMSRESRTLTAATVAGRPHIHNPSTMRFPFSPQPVRGWSLAIAIAATFLVGPAVVTVVEASNKMLMGASSIGELLQNLVKGGELTAAQRLEILSLMSDDFKTMNMERNPQVVDGSFFSGQAILAHLTQQVEVGKISSATSYYIANALDLVPVDPAESFSNPVPKSYPDGTFGAVQMLGHWNQAPHDFDHIYNGIWGYSVGTREYALQGNHQGLHILDVTDPSNIFRVQFISMPNGYVWRDVVTYIDPGTGKGYAYVHSQWGGPLGLGALTNLWVINLSALSGSKPHRVDSNPIPRRAYHQMLGYHNCGHTINAKGGFLFINCATRNTGVFILDVQSNPFYPTLVARWETGDAHDTYLVQGVDVPGLVGKRDLMYSSDGYRSVHTVFDMTDVRSTFKSTGKVVSLTPLGTTNFIQSQYAHSSYATDDGMYWYVFEEENLFDIAIYKMTDPRNPTFIKYFQYSGDGSINSRVHNGRIRGNYLYTAYYYAGFRVFDISDRENPVEVGYWDTYRDPDGDGDYERPAFLDWDGGWNVYVDFPSGNIMCSDTQEGTFVFRVAQ